MVFFVVTRTQHNLSTCTSIPCTVLEDPSESCRGGYVERGLTFVSRYLFGSINTSRDPSVVGRKALERRRRAGSMTASQDGRKDIFETKMGRRISKTRVGMAMVSIPFQHWDEFIIGPPY